MKRKWRGIYGHSYRYQEKWEDAENDKIAIKKSEFCMGKLMLEGQ
jgi:hypothetical protein